MQIETEALSSRNKKLVLELQEFSDNASIVPVAGNQPLNSKQKLIRVPGTFDGMRYDAAPPPLFSNRLICVEPGTVDIRFYPATKAGSPADPISLRIRSHHPFVIGEDLVTTGEWLAIMNGISRENISEKDADSPHYGVSLDEVMVFFTKLNAKVGGGFFLIGEEQWLFVSQTAALIHNRVFGGQEGPEVRFEWVREEFGSYAALMGPDAAAAAKKSGRTRLVRSDVMRPKQQQYLHKRDFWPPQFRSNTLGFRVARYL